MTYEELNPDPFEQPYKYWLMIRNSIRLSEYDKREMLNVVKLDYDNPPKEENA